MVVKADYRAIEIRVKPDRGTSSISSHVRMKPELGNEWAVKNDPDPSMAMSCEISELLRSFAKRHALKVDEILCTISVKPTHDEETP